MTSDTASLSADRDYRDARMMSASALGTSVGTMMTGHGFSIDYDGDPGVTGMGMHSPTQPEVGASASPGTGTRSGGRGGGPGRGVPGILSLTSPADIATGSLSLSTTGTGSLMSPQRPPVGGAAPITMPRSSTGTGARGTGTGTRSSGLHAQAGPMGLGTPRTSTGPGPTGTGGQPLIGSAASASASVSVSGTPTSGGGTFVPGSSLMGRSYYEVVGDD